MTIIVYGVSGATFYTDAYSIPAFGSLVNSAHARGSAVLELYKTRDATTGALSNPVQVNLRNVEYFDLV